MVELMGAWHRMLDLYLAPKAGIVPGTYQPFCTWCKNQKTYQVQIPSIVPGTPKLHSNYNSNLSRNSFT
ncbi:hypothetical protein B0G93_101265 [Bacillus sp. V-88]|nr:hypothetical protein B0G93_101265 [Bacillus sp. V-88]SLJ96415.1 hypothetical protein SAMN06295884_101265 [Bacillus sp. V-88]